MHSTLLRTVTALAFAATGAAQAALITGASGGNTVVDFSQFASQQAIVGTVEVSVLVGESIGLTAQGDNRVGPMGHGLGGNGSWDRSGVLNNSPAGGWFQFTFNAGPVSEVGGFVNYSNPIFGNNPLLQVLDNLGNVLESYDVSVAAPISTPGGLNAGAFRGISRASADIYAFRVSNSFAVLDDLSFNRNNASAVPEPASLALAGLALAAAGIARRRRQ